MIFVRRISKPQILIDNADSWTRDYIVARNTAVVDPSEDNKKIVSNIEKRYNQQQVKDALKKMFNRKCAFCESRVTHVSYGDIEHFKPKSLYPDLCFSWDNFLLSCSICNGKSNKGNRFPLADEDGPIINPTLEDPDAFFYFKYDSEINKFIVLPKNLRAKTTLKIIKLNREDLLEHRNNALMKIVNIIDIIIEKDVSKFELFEKEFSDKDEYYAFIKTIFSKVRSSLQ